MELTIYFFPSPNKKIWYPRILRGVESVQVFTDRGIEFYAGDSLAEFRVKPDAYYIFRKDNKFYVASDKDIVRAYYLPDWYDL